MTIQPDCIVVGAGIVGCALAFALANDDRKVLLLGAFNRSKIAADDDVIDRTRLNRARSHRWRTFTARRCSSSGAIGTA